MKPSDLFGVVVRTIGLMSVFLGCWYLVYGLLAAAGTIAESYQDETRLYFVSGIPFLVAGCFMMRGADWVVRFCYPAAIDDTPNSKVSDAPNSE